jgi:hypothetical protein
MRSRNGSAASSVRSASAASVEMAQEAHDQACRCAQLSPSIGYGAGQPFDHGRERDAAGRVALRVEEHLDVADIVGVRALEIGEGKVVEILLRDQHRHAEVVDVEKILQVAEAIRLPHRVDRRIRQADAVAARQRKHQLRLQAALDVDVQLAFGKPRDQGVGVMHAVASLSGVERGHPRAAALRTKRRKSVAGEKTARG